MTEIEKNSEEYVAVSLEYGPGQTLADSRESKGLSISDVATQLNVTQEIINGLERDDYSNLPPAIYTRGYLRSYANLLNIDPEPLLERQKKLTSAVDVSIKATAKVQPASNRTIIKKKKYKRKKDSSSTLFIVFLVIVLFAIGYGIWTFLTKDTTSFPASNGAGTTIEQTSDNSENVDGETEAGAADEMSENESGISLPVEDSSSNSLPVEQRSESEPEVLSSTETTQTMSLSLPSSNSSATSSSVTSSDPSINSSDEAKQESDEISTNDQLEEESSTELAQNLPNQEQTTENNAASSITEESEASSTKEDTVKLTLAADSYIEIKDATGKRFFFTVIPGLSTKTIQGQSPFNIKLGNAGAVKVEFNGENYDFGNFDLGEVAKFQLK